MQFRGLLAAVGALVVLAGLYFWSEKHRKAEEAKGPKDAPPKIIEVAQSEAEQVEIRRAAGENTVIRKTGNGKWEIVEPTRLACDMDSVNSLLQVVTPLNAEQLVEADSKDLAPYGLAQPALRVIVTKTGGKKFDLLLGDDTPTGSSTFVKLAGDPRVFTIYSYNKSSLDKKASDLRDKRLLTFDSDKLTRVELTAKGQSIEFGKNNKNEWSILKPRPLRADNFQAEELVRRLKDAKMDTSVSDAEAAKFNAAFNGAQPVAVARVTDASGTQQIEVRRDKDKNYYARSSVVEGVHKVNTDLGEGLDKGLDDFRNKKLFDFAFSDPTRVEVRDSARSFSFEKKDDKWQAGGKTMDSTGVQSLVDKLRDLSSIKFLDQGGGTQLLELTVVSDSGKRTEKVFVNKDGNRYIARRDNEPALYELDGKVVEEIQKAAADVKEPPKDDKKDEKKK